MSGSFNPPANPTVGQIYTFGGATWRWDGVAWVNASTGANFVSITGSTMTGPLVLSGNAPASAPLQAVPLQQVATAIAAAPDNVGRNLLHNGMLRVQQRGQGSWTANGNYTADRWHIAASGADACNFVISALSDANRASLGDEAYLWGLNNTFTGSSAAGGYLNVAQSIEDVHRLGGKTVTVSFGAGTNGPALNLGVSVDQNFGSGGSPSPIVNGNGQSVAISGTWQRYSLTFTLPSTAGKTLGTTAGTDYTQLNIWYSSGSANAARAGIGVQSGQIGITGLQLEIGSVATPLEKLDPRMDLANCQRFYQVIQGVQITTYVVGAGATIVSGLPISVMRAAPSVQIVNGVYSNANAWGLNSIYSTFVQAQLAATAAGNVWGAGDFHMSADL